MIIRYFKPIFVIILISLSNPSFVMPGEVVIRDNSELDSDISKCLSRDSYKSILECMDGLCKEYQSVPDAAMKRINCAKYNSTLRSIFLSIESQTKSDCRVLVATNSSEINNPKEIEEQCILNITSELPLLQKNCLEEIKPISMSDMNRVSSCVRSSSKKNVENFITSQTDWYKDAEIGSDANALLNAADKLYIKRKYSEAFGYYLRAAEMGNINGQIKLAEMYYEGKGIEKNTEESLHWYQKAADQGSWEARIKIHEIESKH